MVNTLMMVLVCLAFVVVSLALAFNFAVRAYLDWQEQDVAIKYGIQLISKREEESDDDDSFN